MTPKRRFRFSPERRGDHRTGRARCGTPGARRTRSKLPIREEHPPRQGGDMSRQRLSALVLAAAAAVLASCQQMPGERAGAGAAAPKFAVDPAWPKPLPENWILGQVAGIAVDKDDRIWVLHRPTTLVDDEKGATLESADHQVLPPGAGGAAVRRGRQPAARAGAGRGPATTGRRASTASSSTWTATSGWPGTATPTTRSSSSPPTASSCSRSASAARPAARTA